MELDRHVEELRRQLAVAAEAGGEPAREVADRLIAALEPAARLVLLDVLGEAADEITRDLAPGSVELRLRNREPELAVTPPPPDLPAAAPVDATPSSVVDVAADDGAMTRINLRLPDQLKARVDEAAGREGVSTNAWLVRAATAALGPRPEPGPTVERFRGWAR